MKAIWKFQLWTDDVQTVKMPVGAKILTLQTQYETPCLWALVDPSEQQEERSFRIFGTGHPMNDSDVQFAVHIGTYQLNGGSLIFHVFEDLGSVTPG